MKELGGEDPFLQILSGLSGSHVYYMPNPGNAGDAFIAYATYLLFDSYNIQVTSLSPDQEVKGATLIVGGGGNLVEGMYGEVRRILENNVKHNRCILFPHTMFGNRDLLSQAGENFVLCCRDPISYQFALASGADKKFTHLCHDITFYLNGDIFADFLQQGTQCADILRADGESSNLISRTDRNIDISLSWNGALWHNRELARHVTLSLAAFISPYESVRTDRLHICILSAYLDKAVTMYPNSYYKNRAIFQHSIKVFFPKVFFSNTGTDLPYAEILEERIRMLENVNLSDG